MKTQIIIAEDEKQIVLIPQTESERQMLKVFQPDESIDLVIKQGTTYSGGNNPYSGQISKSEGGALRFYEGGAGVILVLSPKKNIEVKALSEDEPKYSLQDLKTAFVQSRLTHSIAGFKHDSFDDFIQWFHNHEV